MGSSGDDFGPYRVRSAELGIGGTTVAVNEIEEIPGLPDFDAIHGLVRAIVRRGESVVIRHELDHYGACEWHFWLDCVGDCASVTLSLLGGSQANEHGVPYLLGAKAAIRLICSLVPVPSEHIYESRPVQRDFRGFSHLWADRDPPPDGFDSHRPSLLLLGTGVAEMHRNGFIHGDLHGGNLFLDLESQTVTPIDFATVIKVCPPAASALCATDLVPLMQDMSAPVWRVFREGYLAGWPEGRSVIDLIERRDRTGWAAALDAGDDARAAQLLQDALVLTAADDAETQLYLTMKLVECLLKVGEAHTAVGHAEHLVPLAEELDLPANLVDWQRFSLAVAASMSGDKVRALAILFDILRSEDLDPSLQPLATQVLNEVLASIQA